jgi:predicted HNH restriction endonuclease
MWSTDLRETLEAQQLGQFDTCKFLDNILGHHAGKVTVVVEQYNITADTIKKTRQTASLEIIGVARYFSELMNHPFYYKQTSSAAKRFMTDDKLKALDWWNRSDHVRDAYRHLGLYLAKEMRDEGVLLAGKC